MIDRTQRKGMVKIIIVIFPSLISVNKKSSSLSSSIPHRPYLIIFSMKDQAPDRDTLQTDASRELHDLYYAPMTVQQRQLFSKGLFFPQSIVYSTEAAMKEESHQWSKNIIIQLTTDAFAGIPLTHITKAKLLCSDTSEKLIIKIKTKKCHLYLMRRQNAIAMFGGIVWAKMATMNLFSKLDQRFETEIKGEIFKKSEFFKNWEKRMNVMNKEKGLKSFKNPKEQATIKIEQTTQIWTRFDTIMNDSYLNVKLWRGIRKEEFGLPIQTTLEWIQGLCHLIK